MEKQYYWNLVVDQFYVNKLIEKRDVDSLTGCLQEFVQMLEPVPLDILLSDSENVAIMLTKKEEWLLTNCSKIILCSLMDLKDLCNTIPPELQPLCFVSLLNLDHKENIRFFSMFSTVLNHYNISSSGIFHENNAIVLFHRWMLSFGTCGHVDYKICEKSLIWLQKFHSCGKTESTVDKYVLELLDAEMSSYKEKMLNGNVNDKKRESDATANEFFAYLVQNWNDNSAELIAHFFTINSWLNFLSDSSVLKNLLERISCLIMKRTQQNKVENSFKSLYGIKTVLEIILNYNIDRIHDDSSWIFGIILMKEHITALHELLGYDKIMLAKLLFFRACIRAGEFGKSYEVIDLYYSDFNFLPLYAYGLEFLLSDIQNKKISNIIHRHNVFNLSLQNLDWERLSDIAWCLILSLCFRENGIELPSDESKIKIFRMRKIYENIKFFRDCINTNDLVKAIQLMYSLEYFDWRIMIMTMKLTLNPENMKAFLMRIIVIFQDNICADSTDLQKPATVFRNYLNILNDLNLLQTFGDNELKIMQKIDEKIDKDFNDCKKLKSILVSLITSKNYDDSSLIIQAIDLSEKINQYLFCATLYCIIKNYDKALECLIKVKSENIKGYCTNSMKSLWSTQMHEYYFSINPHVNISPIFKCDHEKHDFTCFNVLVEFYSVI